MKIAGSFRSSPWIPGGSLPGIAVDPDGSTVPASLYISTFGSFAFTDSDRQKRRGAMADTVLVVDDEEYIRELLRTFLTETGYNVIVAAHGEEALDLAKKEGPQVIILDVKMPGIDGIETCRRLKSEEGTRVIPVIVATALRETLPEVLDAGANDFVTKPFHLTELLTRIRSILRVKHLTDELERACAYIRELQKEFPRH